MKVLDPSPLVPFPSTRLLELPTPTEPKLLGPLVPTLNRAVRRLSSEEGDPESVLLTEPLGVRVPLRHWGINE